MHVGSCWLAVYPLLLGLTTSDPSAEEPKPTTRPISEAKSVLAIYREDWGLRSSGEFAIIFAAWPDGFIIWSGDNQMGGSPYRAGRVDPKRVSALLARFETDGLFADESFNRGNFGPDSRFTTILVKSEKKQVEMRSWHESYEERGGLVVDDHGVSQLNGRRRLDVLRKAPAEYLFYRFVWSETRSRLVNLIPCESKAIAGKPVMQGGKLSWQEPAATGDDRP